MAHGKFEESMVMIMKKRFNVTGTCIPQKHYMVNIQSKIEQIEALIENDNYFSINRARQFGKTTTLFMLWKNLKDFSLGIGRYK